MKMDEDDIRHDVFSIIYEMLLDNIELRVKQNKLNLRILNQAQLSLDKTVHNYLCNENAVFVNAPEEANA